MEKQSYVDLHIHSTCSDGTMTPEEICQRAAKRGVSLISICDHNCIDALPRLAAAAEKQGLCWIKGVELDCAFETAYTIFSPMDLTRRMPLLPALSGKTGGSWIR